MTTTAPSNEPRESISEANRRVPAKLVARALGIPPRTLRRRRHRWGGVIESGPRGGRELRFLLSALPADVQVKVKAFLVTEGRVPEQAATDDAPERALEADRERSGPEINTADGAWESAPENYRAIAIERDRILTAYRDFCSCSMRPAAGGIAKERTRRTFQFIAHWRATNPSSLKFGKSSLYAWDRMERKRGRAGLLPGWATGPREQKLATEIRNRFDQLYLKPQRLSVATARRIVHGQLAMQKSPLMDDFPCEETFRRYVDRLPSATVVLAREGEQAFRRQFEPHIERDYTTIPVMQCWMGDHAIFDFFCRDEAGRVIRPWLTLWMDVRSRRRVGWLVHAGPSQDTILAALAMGMLRLGIPEQGHTDNGRDFSVLTVAGSSRRWRLKLEEPRIRTMTEHLGMVWHFAIPKQPQGKGAIERAFGVDRDRFDRLQIGYCGPDNASKPDDLKGVLKTPRLLPTIVEVHAKYSQYVEQVANELPHEGQGMDGRSPREVFEAEEYVKRTATADTLRLLLMRCSRPVTVQRNGIWAFDRWYWSEAIAACNGQQVYYRYSLDDLSVIHCFSLQDQLIGSVSRRELVGVTSKDHRKYLREKQAVRRTARMHLANLEKRASVTDALAALSASARLERPDSPPAGDPESAQRVVQIVRTPLEAAAKQIKTEKIDRERRARLKREVTQQTAKLYPGSTGNPAPDDSVIQAQLIAKRKKYFAQQT